jgi:hypothetical protein
MSKNEECTQEATVYKESKLICEIEWNFQIVLIRK